MEDAAWPLSHMKFQICSSFKDKQHWAVSPHVFIKEPTTFSFHKVLKTMTAVEAQMRSFVNSQWVLFLFSCKMDEVLSFKVLFY